MNRNCEAIGREETYGGDTVLIPTRVELSVTIAAISSSVEASGGITSSRTHIVCWGNNFNGCLGRKTLYRGPSGVGNMMGWIRKEFCIKALCFGNYHGMVLTISSEVKEGQKLWIWGDNYFFQHGNGISDNQEHAVASEVPFFGKRSLEVEKIECGVYSCACITLGGALYMWGSLSDFNQIRHPILVSFGEGTCRCLNISLSFSLALSVCEIVSLSGETRRMCYSWGYRIQREVGTVEAKIPTEIAVLNSLPANSRVVEIGVSDTSAFCIV